MNFITSRDSYKFLHPRMYPPDLRGMYAYFESRGGRYDETVFYGLQGIIAQNLEGPLFDLADIDHAEEFTMKHLGVTKEQVPADKWRSLYHKYGGCLPLEIKAVPEGTLVPTHNVLFTVESTDEEFAWLVGMIEDEMVWSWYPTTVATQSFYLKRFLKGLREQYSDNLDGLEFMVHDFGYRGVAGQHQQAGVGGSAHLLSFRGTDTTAGIYYLDGHYGEEHKDISDIMWDKSVPSMSGFSIPATEHSIILAWEDEESAFQHVLDTFPSGMVACVSDTYDIFNACENLWGDSLLDQVMERDGVLVVRPDSGEPRHVVLIVLDILAEKFGYTVNSKGKRVLNTKIRVIQGDKMDYLSIPEIYNYIVKYGYAPENLTVGSGGGMLQEVSRDTNKFAYKVSAVDRGEEWRGVSKHPITDSTKNSKAGKFVLINHQQQGWYTAELRIDTARVDQLQTVFRNGETMNHQSYTQIRERIDNEL